MNYFAYRSTALIPRNSQETQKLVAQSQCGNAIRDLTGFLYREDDVFFQYLEGPANGLESLIDRLLTDRRHKDMITLGRGSSPRRYFADWRMGFSNPSRPELALFLWEAWGKTSTLEANAQDLRLFFTGTCQRLDLGLAS